MDGFCIPINDDNDTHKLVNYISLHCSLKPVTPLQQNAHAK